MSSTPSDSPSLIEDLRARGLLKAVTDEAVADHLAGGTRTIYAGFDPTADSLHIGNLVSLMTLRRFQLAGHRVVALVGGATGMIGDPSGRDEERNLLDEATLAENIRGVQRDIHNILDPATDGAGEVVHVNNADWIGGLSLVPFLRDIGKRFRVNVLLKMDSIRDRLEREVGLSYTEFSYALIQAYDFAHLHGSEGCTVQLGGSDQWGNITAGLDLIRSQSVSDTGDGARENKAYGLTMELLLDAEGKKFGKSTGGGSLWLSPERTSPYRFFQYFLNTRDEQEHGSEVERYLKTFSLRSVAEIGSLMAEHNQAKHERRAQTALAEELTERVHGAEGLAAAQQATRVLFDKKLDIREVPESVLAMIYPDLETTGEVPAAEVEGGSLTVADLFVAAKLAGSKGEIRRLVKEGGAYLNNEKIDDATTAVSRETFAGKSLLALRKGKKQFGLVRISG